MKKQVLSAIVSAAMALTLLAGCGGSSSGSSGSAAPAADTGCDIASDSPYVLYFPWAPVTADDLK